MSATLRDEQAERFGRGLNYLFNDWVERSGPVKDCEVRIRKHTVKRNEKATRGVATSMTLARHTRSNFYHYHRRGVLFAVGEDAAFVYDLTSYYISEAGDAARRVQGRAASGERRARSEPLLISLRPDCEKT